MHRTLKIATYGVALAVIAGGTLAWTTVDKTVQLDAVDVQHMAHTTGNRVQDALAAGGITVSTHDLVAPELNSRIHDGSRVVLHRGRLLRLSIDGTQRAVWTTEPTVDGALAALGYSVQNYSSVSRDQRLPLTPTAIEIRGPKRVTVRHDGTTTALMTTDLTVSALLSDAGIAVGKLDRLSVAATSLVTDGQQIVLRRVRRQRVTQSGSIPYRTQQRNDNTLEIGTTAVVTPGTPGARQLSYAVVYVDGVATGRTLVGTKVLKPAVDRVVRVGTKAVTPQEIAAQLVAAHGWSSDQMNCLTPLWNHESGWRIDATNADSGAYGIPQALPGDKMATVGPDWRTSARTQITWGLNYISGVYGTPCGAWDHELAANWY